MIRLTGGAGSVTPPKFIVAGTGNIAQGNVISLAGLQIGDLVIGFSMGLSVGAYVDGWAQYTPQVSSGAVVGNVNARVISPQDVALGTVTVQSQSSGTYAAAVFRNIFSFDGAATGKTGSSTSPITNAFTTVQTNDIIVNCMGANATTTISGSNGFTTACALNGVGGVSFAILIEYKLGAAAGSQPASSGAVLGTSQPWTAFAMGLCPLTV